MLQFTGFKFCPHCGEQSLSVFRKNGIQCSNCGFIYFHNAAAAVGGIIKREEGILLAQRAHEPKTGMYDLPGGFVDYSEKLEDALKREILEETGLVITNLDYLGSFPNTYYYENVTYFTSDAFFVCTGDEAQMPRTSPEVSGYIFVKPDEIPYERLAFDSGREALKFYSSTLR